jgi:hypothetical protein
VPQRLGEGKSCVGPVGRGEKLHVETVGRIHVMQLPDSNAVLVIEENAKLSELSVFLFSLAIYKEVHTSLREKGGARPP